MAFVDTPLHSSGYAREILNFSISPVTLRFHASSLVLFLEQHSYGILIMNFLLISPHKEFFPVFSYSFLCRLLMDI